MPDTIPPGYKKTEIGIIPEDWEVKRLGEVGAFKSGSGFPLTYQNHKKGDYPFFKVVNLGESNMFLKYSSHWISEEIRKKINANLFSKGTIAFAKIGAAIFLERKKILQQDSCIDNNMMGYIIDKTKVETLFVYYLFNMLSFSDLVETTALPSLSKDNLENIPVPLPPLPEQRAIARILSDIDELIESIDKLIKKKKLIKKGAMHQLLTGKKRLPGFKGEWVRKRLGEVGKIITGGTPPTKIKKYWNGKITWVTPTDVSEKKDIYDSERKITKEGQKLVGDIPENTLLVTCIASIGKNAILRVNGACNQQINAVIPDKNYDVDFLYYTLELNSKRLFEMAGTTATPIISKSEFSQFTITLPPTLAEQKAIAQILSDMDAEIEALERKKQKYEMIKKGTMELLLTGKVRVKEENGEIKEIEVQK